MAIRSRTSFVASKATLGLSSVDTHAILVFSTTASYLSNLGQTAATSSHLMNAAGYEAWQPIYLTAGTYDRLGVYTTVAAVSTWRLGIDNNTTGFRPDTNLLDAGTVDMNAAAGLQQITISLTISADGWYWFRAKVDAYTASPTVMCVNGNSATPTQAVPVLGWPIANSGNAGRYAVGLNRQNASGTGSLPTAPTITGSPVTGLTYTEIGPKFYIRKAS